MNEILVGDIVILRSGGPAMTIIEIREDGFVAARWFDNCELRYDAFDRRELVRVQS